MTITLQKTDGDLFLDPETGRGVEITGSTKTDQELADLYLSDYDADRGWGSSFDLASLMGGNSSIDQVKALTFFRLQQANDRILDKQSKDPTLMADEVIHDFPLTDVFVDASTQSIVFFSVADVGNTTIAQTIGLTFKPTSMRQVLPPPPGIIPSN